MTTFFGCEIFKQFAANKKSKVFDSVVSWF